MPMKIISDGEALEIYRKSLERKVAAKYADQLATAMPGQDKEIRKRMKQEVEAELANHEKKKWFGWLWK